MSRNCALILMWTVLGVCFLAPRAMATPPAVWVNDESQIGYRVIVWENGDPDQQTVIEGTLDSIVRGQLVSPGVRLYPWRRTQSTGDPQLVEERWDLSVIAEAPGVGVYEVEFPILKLNRFTAFSGQDRLIVPYGPGKAIVDPWNTPQTSQGGKPRTRNAIWYGVYGDSSQSMQMIIYDDGNPDPTQSRGLIFRTMDPDFHMKDFHVDKMGENDIFPDGTVYASIHHYPDNAGQPGTSYTGPGRALYLVATTCYEGGWERAVRERYGNWAKYQEWTAKGKIVDRIDSGNLPAWYGDNVMWATAYGFPSDLTYLTTKVQPAFPDIEVGVFLTMWQRWPFDSFVPDYFPPKDPTTFAALQNLQGDATSQNAGIHVFPYINSNVVDLDYNSPLASGADANMQTTISNLIADARFIGPCGVIPNPDKIPGWSAYGNPMPGPSLSDNYFDPAEFWGNHAKFLDTATQQWTGDGLTEQFRNSLMAVRKKPWADSDVQNLVNNPLSVTNATGPGLYAPQFYGHKYQRDGIYNYLQSTWRAAPDGNGDYITPAEINSSTVISRRKVAVMCRHTDQWHDFLLAAYSQLLDPNGYDMHGVYLDQFDKNRNAPLCFASNHTLDGQTHAPGFGPYVALGSRKLAGDIAAENPGKVIFAEQVSEASVDVVQEHYMSYPQKPDDIVVPLFATVYQGYTSFHEWYVPNAAISSSNRADFIDATAMGVHMGFKLGAIRPALNYFNTADANATASLAYLKTTASMLQQNLTKLVTYGQRMSDPQFVGAVPTQSITRYGSYGGSVVINAPAVRGSCWKMFQSPNQRLVLLSNSSSSPVTVTVKSPIFSDLEVLTDKALNASGQPTNDTFTYSASAGVTVTVPAQGWRALVR